MTSCAGANGFANMMLFGTPFDAQSSASLPHVNDGKVGVDFSGVSGDIPAVDPVSPQIDVGNKGSIFAFGCVKQLNGIFAGGSYFDLEAAIRKGLFHDALNKLVVLNDQDN